MRQVLVFNPAAGGGQAASVAELVAEILRGAGHDVELLASDGPGRAAALVAERCKRGFPDAVIALGGDGTLNEVAWGLHRAGAVGEHPPLTALGVVPLGTTNVVARDLGLPLEPRAAAVSLALGRTRPYDLGLCESGGEVRPFLLACGVGFEAEAAADVTPFEKRFLGSFAYVASGLRGLFRSRPSLDVDFVREDGVRESVRTMSLIAGNSRLYAGFARLSRNARNDDGLLELVLLPSTAPLALLRVALSGLASDVEVAGGVRVVRVRTVEVRSERPVRAHVDAEPVLETPLSLRVLPRALSFLAPPP